MATAAPRAPGRGRVKSMDSILATAEKKSLKRSLGAFQLTLLGIGAVIGTGIFVLTATAAQKAGPGMMVSFIVAGTVCALAALCYSELASMVPVAGSAYGRLVRIHHGLTGKCRSSFTSCPQGRTPDSVGFPPGR